MAMELVLRYMADVRFGYSDRTADIVEPTTDERILKRRARADWVKTARAVYETRKPVLGEKVAWLELSNRYMSADRVSSYAHPHDRSQLMTYKEAAIRFQSEASDLREEVMRQRRGRRRFPHH